MVNGNMFSKLRNELKNVRSIDLAWESVNYVERGFWMLLAVLGIAWACYFIPGQIELWKESPSIVTKGQAELSDLKYPGISIRMPGSTKYGIAERMGNFLKSDDPLEEFIQVRNIFLVCGLVHRSNEFRFGGSAYLDKDFYDTIINGICLPFGYEYKRDVNTRTACDEVIIKSILIQNVCLIFFHCF